jgi:hypothetical protein
MLAIWDLNVGSDAEVMMGETIEFAANAVEAGAQDITLQVWQVTFGQTIKQSNNQTIKQVPHTSFAVRFVALLFVSMQGLWLRPHRQAVVHLVSHHRVQADPCRSVVRVVRSRQAAHVARVSVLLGSVWTGFVTSFESDVIWNGVWP